MKAHWICDADTAQRADMSALGAVKMSLDRATSIADVALTAGESVSDLLKLMREKVVAAKDTSLNTTSRQSLNADFQGILKNFSQVLNSAVFDGANLLDGSQTADMTFLADADAGQAITLSKKLADKGAVNGAGLAKLMASEKRDYTFAQTFPTGTHAMWLYYWLAAHGINPMKDAKVITVPPPQMVANMRVGNMDGFCVGEPWNHRAIIDGIGVTATTTQEIWKDHPEKVLGTTGEFVKKYPNTARAVTAAIIEAGKWIDASLSNKNKMAETIADKSYVNTGVDAINQRILGRYQNGLGKTWDDPNHMKFFNDGAVNYPYLSDGMWFLTQHKRWGLLKSDPDYLGVAKAINKTTLYKEAAAQLKISVPKSDLRSSKLIDGVVWDGKDPAKYADGFKIKA